MHSVPSFTHRQLYTLCVGILLTVLLLIPLRAHALIPFGGMTLLIRPCNTGLLATVGPPRPGEYMWTPATRTYLYGPPSPGRWLLGNAAPPTLCFLGIHYIGAGPIMIMLGSSGL